MSITNEEVRDLRPGDVVELRDERWPDVVQRGPLHASDEQTLSLGGQIVRHRAEVWAGKHKSLTVISRAPRPLYVNHPRTKPVPGDIADYVSRSTLTTIGPFLYGYTARWAGTSEHGSSTRWVGLPGCNPDTGPDHNAGRLRLLVDGETGQVVP